MYARGRTLFDHRQLAQETLGFRWVTEHQNRAFVRVLRNEAARLPDKDQMLVFARRWLYDHKFLIESKRAFNTQITTALDLFETQTGEIITIVALRIGQAPMCLARSAGGGVSARGKRTFNAKARNSERRR